MSGCGHMVRSFSVLLLLLVTAAAYDIFLVLEDGIYLFNPYLINLI